MERDIKKMLEDYKPIPPKIPEGHEKRFFTKLDKAFPEAVQNQESKRERVQWLKIAAILVVLIAVSFFGYQRLSGPTADFPDASKSVVGEDGSKPLDSNSSQQLTLADISPDLKKVEEYYITGINVQLASLQITDENKELVNGYMQQLAVLDKEYSELSGELSKTGPTEATITAMFDNLKLRLDLLFKLKNRLNELNTQNNEEFKSLQT
ncbi:MAG TPA: hypothetical protein VKX40_04005 [Aequorivita sp.]|nr:hypothetical protein [Aequorivita sp.]